MVFTFFLCFILVNCLLNYTAQSVKSCFTGIKFKRDLNAA